jgi:hypothetical protein
MALISFSRQAGLGWLSPDEYEAAWHTDQDDHPQHTLPNQTRPRQVADPPSYRGNLTLSSIRPGRGRYRIGVRPESF